LSFALDANVLLYASDETIEYHRPARAFLVQTAGEQDRFWDAYRRVAGHAGA
jgi:predicted nucleic acid-binding protein